MISAQLNVNQHSAEIRYENESKQSGLISAIFERNRNYSLGKFHFPLIAELEYHSQQHLNAAFTFFVSPQSCDNQHHIFLLLTYRKNRLFDGMKKLFLLPFIKLALKQDKAIIKQQAINLAYFPEAQFKSTELDMLRAHIERILNQKSVDHQKSFKLYM